MSLDVPSWCWCSSVIHPSKRVWSISTMRWTEDSPLDPQLSYLYFIKPSPHLSLLSNLPLFFSSYYVSLRLKIQYHMIIPKRREKFVVSLRIILDVYVKLSSSSTFRELRLLLSMDQYHGESGSHRRPSERLPTPVVWTLTSTLDPDSKTTGLPWPPFLHIETVTYFTHRH